MLNPGMNDYCEFGDSESAKLVVVVDTEEEFDWSKPVSRNNVSTDALNSLPRMQSLFDEFDVVPVYVIDYPVATQKSGCQILGQILESGKCLIGAHLHPWVNPPHSETVSEYNSFPGNLAVELEAKKLQILRESIERNFGIQPTIYKAGRYGIGRNTAALLEAQGFLVDVSVRAHGNFSNIQGPDFSRYSAWPYWFGQNEKLLEIPITSGFCGSLRRWGSELHRFGTGPLGAKIKARGIMKRLGVVRKLDLSPEGFSVTDMKCLVQSLYDDGLRVFSMAFHSPTLQPGNTPYVRSQDDLEQFLQQCREFLSWFTGPFGGLPSNPLDIRRALLRSRSMSAVS